MGGARGEVPFLTTRTCTFREEMDLSSRSLSLSNPSSTIRPECTRRRRPFPRGWGAGAVGVGPRVRVPRAESWMASAVAARADSIGVPRRGLRSSVKGRTTSTPCAVRRPTRWHWSRADRPGQTSTEHLRRRFAGQPDQAVRRAAGVAAEAELEKEHEVADVGAEHGFVEGLLVVAIRSASQSSGERHSVRMAGFAHSPSPSRPVCTVNRGPQACQLSPRSLANMSCAAVNANVLAGGVQGPTRYPGRCDRLAAAHGALCLTGPHPAAGGQDLDEARRTPSQPPYEQRPRPSRAEFHPADTTGRKLDKDFHRAHNDGTPASHRWAHVVRHNHGAQSQSRFEADS